MKLQLRSNVQDKAIEAMQQALKRPRLIAFEPEEFDAIRQALIERRDAAARANLRWP